MGGPTLVDQLDAADALKKMTVGASAAVITKTTTAPLDRIKLVLQVQNGSLALQKYTSTSHCFVTIANDQGVLALWRGNGASVLKCIPTHALNFLLRDIYRGIFLAGISRSESCKYFAGSVLSGGFGGATALSLLYPLDFARTRMAVDAKANGTRRYDGVFHCLQRTRNIGGVGAWYRGFSSALQFVFVSRAVFFGLFDTIRTGFVVDQRDMPFLATLTLAQSCLLLSGFTCYPLDTLRRRLMMVDAPRSVRAAFPSPSNTTRTMLQHIIRKPMNGSRYANESEQMISSLQQNLIISVSLLSAMVESRVLHNSSHNASHSLVTYKSLDTYSSRIGLLGNAADEDPSRQMITFVLVLIAAMLAFIVLFTLVHCIVFCGLAFGGAEKKKPPHACDTPYIVFFNSKDGPLLVEEANASFV